MPLDGLSFAGFLQPPSVPADPIGDSWRGLPGAQGIPGPPGDAILGFGMAIGNVPQFINYNTSGIPGLVYAAGRGPMLVRTTPAATDQWDLRLRREVAFAGGASTNVNANLRLDNIAGVSDATQETSLLIVSSTNSNVSGLSPALWVQSTRNAGSNAYISSGVFVSNDATGLSSSASGAGNATTEIDHLANGADDAANGATFGGFGVRKLIHLQAGRTLQGDTTQTEVSTGLWFGTVIPTGAVGGTNDPHSNFQQAIGFAPSTQVRNVLDTRGAITPAGSSNPVSAVTMTAGHVIDFNGGAALTSAPGRYLQYTTTGTARLRYMAGATEAFSISDAAAFTVGGTLVGNATIQGQSGLVAGTNSIAGTVLINGAAAQTRYIQWMTAGVQRMRFGIDNTAESGSNAGSVPFINVATDAGVATQAWSVNRNTAQSAFPLIRLGKAAVYTGIAPTNDMGTLNVSASYSGSTDHSAWTHLSSWFINSDTVDVGSAQQAIGLRGVHQFGGGTTTGSRSGLHWTVQQIGAMPAHAQYQAGLFSVEGNYSSGGSDLFDNTGGVLFGAGIYSTLKSGGTNWRGVVGAEIDYGIYAGATAAGITGLQIVRWNLHAYSPANFDNDNILKFTGGTTNLAKIGIQFGDYNGYPGIDPTGKMMDVVIGPGGDHTFPMGYGLDLKIPTFAATAFRSKGFSVLGDGSVQVGTAYLSSDSSGSSLDAKGSYVSAAAVATGGANLWTSEMLIDDVTGTVLSITATNNGAGPGAATAVSIYRVGYSLSPPANPVTFRVVGYAPANGMGAPTAPTINLTWTAQNALAIQPTAGGKLGFNGATPIIKPTGVAVTAAGIHAALTSLGLIAP